MDRGFGRSPLSGHRQDRPYDDFYNDRRSRGSFRSTPRGGSVNNRNNRDFGGQQWGGGGNRDRGFFGQSGQGYSGHGRDFLDGQMLAQLKQQQNLLSVFMSSGGGANQNVGGRYNQGFNQQRNNRTPNRNNQRGIGSKRRESHNYSNIAQKKQKRMTSQTFTSKSSDVKPKEPEIVIPDEDVVIPDSLMDSVERLRQRKDIERNVADEDIDKLVVFCFNGRGYNCKTCGVLVNSKQLFVSHLSGKPHIMRVIEARTAKKYQEIRDVLEIDLSPDDWFENSDKAQEILMKQAKLMMKTMMQKELLEKLNYNKNPSNFITVNMETRRSAIKSENTVTITSLVESRVEVKEFDGDKFFGCEFVQAVSGFHCRLCDIYIKEASKVVPHITDRIHRNNYQNHLRKNENYEKQQRNQNTELAGILEEEEGKNVLLSQTPGVADSPFLSLLEDGIVTIPKLLNPAAAVEKEENEAEEGEIITKEDDSATETEESLINEEGNEDQDKNEVETEEEANVVGDEKRASCGDDVDDTKVLEERESLNDVETPERTVEPELKPKKSILKKSRGGVNKRGRGRGRGSPASRIRKDMRGLNDASAVKSDFLIVDE